MKAHAYCGEPGNCMRYVIVLQYRMCGVLLQGATMLAAQSPVQKRGRNNPSLSSDVWQQHNPNQYRIRTAEYQTKSVPHMHSTIPNQYRTPRSNRIAHYAKEPVGRYLRGQYHNAILLRDHAALRSAFKLRRHLGPGPLCSDPLRRASGLTRAFDRKGDRGCRFSLR
eukprot:673721-Rhodomonas_salina.1